MSWQIFRENVLRIVSQPENINDIDLVAETYAKEYDSCIKRGGDSVNKIPIAKGDVAKMKNFFKSALKQGVSTTTKYDLVGQMGKGVIAYWTNAQMVTITAPLVTLAQIAVGATANLFATQNTVINPGTWIGANSVQAQQSTPNPNKSKDTTNEPLNSNTKQSILFVGDSVTAGSYSYPNIIAKKYSNILVDILAIGGKTTGWMLDNLPTQLSLKKYDRVYIYGGINDSFNDSISTQTALNNVQKMVNLVTNTGAIAVVIIGYNTDNSTDFNKIPTTIYVKDKTLYIPMIEKYKKYQELLKTNIQNAQFVGKFEIGKLSDGLHPSSVQHSVIAKIIKDGL
jgi:lysophospholipase L1-like esterase